MVSAKMGLRYLIPCCLVLFHSSWVAGEAVFICPQPLPGANDTSMGTCGGGINNGTFLEVSPGPFSIKFTDTARLNGSSYRVSLRSWDSDTQYCVLMDRIPSSDCISTVKPNTDDSSSANLTVSNSTIDNSNTGNSTTAESTNSTIDSQSIGNSSTANSTVDDSNVSNSSIANANTSLSSADSSSVTEMTDEVVCSTEYFITVDIPSISCDNCYLQITTINPDGSDCLVDMDSVQSECPLYHSCTNIRLKGGLEKQTLRQCQAQYLNYKNEWPYKTENRTSKFAIDFRGHLDTFQFAVGTFSYTPMGRTRGRLSYQVELWVGSTVILNEVTIAWPTGRENKWATFRPLRRTPTYGTYKGFLIASSVPNLKLMNDSWYIRITHKTNATDDLEFKATYVPLVRTAQVYSDISGNYTDDGWLSGPEFDGESPSLSHVVKPAGDCPPKPPTTTTVATTSIQTKEIPKDPDGKGTRRQRNRSFFTKSASERTNPSVSGGLLVALVICFLALVT